MFTMTLPAMLKNKIARRERVIYSSFFDVYQKNVRKNGRMLDKNGKPETIAETGRFPA